MALDTELWEEALRLEREHGNEGLLWIADRILDCEHAGDVEGIRRLKAIGDRYRALNRVTAPAPEDDLTIFPKD